MVPLMGCWQLFLLCKEAQLALAQESHHLSRRRLLVLHTQYLPLQPQEAQQNLHPRVLLARRIQHLLLLLQEY